MCYGLAMQDLYQTQNLLARLAELEARVAQLEAARGKKPLSVQQRCKIIRHTSGKGYSINARGYPIVRVAGVYAGEWLTVSDAEWAVALIKHHLFPEQFPPVPDAPQSVRDALAYYLKPLTFDHIDPEILRQAILDSQGKLPVLDVAKALFRDLFDESCATGASAKRRAMQAWLKSHGMAVRRLRGAQGRGYYVINELP